MLKQLIRAIGTAEATKAPSALALHPLRPITFASFRPTPEHKPSKVSKPSHAFHNLEPAHIKKRCEEAPGVEADILSKDSTTDNAMKLFLGIAIPAGLYTSTHVLWNYINSKKSAVECKTPTAEDSQSKHSSRSPS